ncbi:MAG: TIGR02099 family protein, partial [Burkholderiales bacterium]|nr:TIGR02099 family protein [Burkholderiales bacterium]
AQIERLVSAAIVKQLSIGGIAARWQGLHPEVELSDVRIHDAQGRVALSLPAVEAVVGWRSLAFGSLRLHSLAIEQPVLDIRRAKDGRISVAGLELQEDGSGSAFSTWLLAQNEVVVRDARIQWDDELRGAPTLSLAGVTLALRNRGAVHRFALKAQPARELASALDVRGEVRGSDFSSLAEWRGLAFAELEYVDLAAWQPWLDYPIEVNAGKGALRFWVTFDGSRIIEATADVALAKVQTRLGRDLPLLHLDYLRGRIGGSDDGATVKLHGHRFALKSAGGVALPPADFRVTWRRGAEHTRPQGEIDVNTLELAPLARLAGFLPFSDEARTRLSEFGPRGTLNNLKLTWGGDARDLDRFSVKGRFERLGLNAPGGRALVAGLSGSIDANQSAGALQLRSERVSVELPGVLKESRVELDRLAARVNWKRMGERYEARFAEVSVENRELSASVQGSFTTALEGRAGPGTIDLTANIARASARAVYRYIPVLPETVAGYLRTTILAGEASDARLRLRGDLQGFPWADGKSGQFRVSGRFTGGELDYAGGWPRATNLGGEILMEGAQLRVSAARGSVLGVRASNVVAVIPDYVQADPRLSIDLQADGATGEFLRFLRSSPLQANLGAGLEEISATGSGRLQLRLDIPLEHVDRTRVSGAYQLLGNEVAVAASFPPLGQVNGRVEFTESGFVVRNAAARVLGGPVTFSVSTGGNEELAITAQGAADLAAVRAHFDLPMLDRVRGIGTWRGSITLAGSGVEFSLESPLTGVVVDLPIPFGKAATASVPFRLERTTRAAVDWLGRAGVKQLPPGADALRFAYGRAASGLVIRRSEGGKRVLERGALGLNEAAPAPGRSGFAVAGRIAELDLDQWRAVFGGADHGVVPVSDLKLSIDALDVAGRRLNEVQLSATPMQQGWSADLTARELAGRVNWLPQGRGRVVARLMRLSVPDTSPVASASARETASAELPALDVTADDFRLRETRLGRLELVAVNESRDWLIEKLVLRAADSELRADGRWQSRAAQPDVNLEVNLDVSDIGAYLTRLGFPGTVKGGTANLNGRIGWAGAPQSIDYPTLAGELRLSAEKGQFLKAEPGISKLLGILSLQSWITLDFRDTFAEGFSFGSIKASARISKGRLSTEDFVMAGNAALVTMSGVIDLGEETQNLKVNVVPSVGDSVSSGVALFLANPIAGLAAFLAQRILKDPLGKVFATEYVVTGTWSDPKVERARRIEPAPQGGP